MQKILVVSLLLASVLMAAEEDKCLVFSESTKVENLSDAGGFPVYFKQDGKYFLGRVELTEDPELFKLNDLDQTFRFADVVVWKLPRSNNTLDTSPVLATTSNTKFVRLKNAGLIDYFLDRDNLQIYSVDDFQATLKSIPANAEFLTNLRDFIWPQDKELFLWKQRPKEINGKPALRSYSFGAKVERGDVISLFNEYGFPYFIVLLGVESCYHEMNSFNSIKRNFSQVVLSAYFDTKTIEAPPYDGRVLHCGQNHFYLFGPCSIIN